MQSTLTMISLAFSTMSCLDIEQHFSATTILPWKWERGQRGVSVPGKKSEIKMATFTKALLLLVESLGYSWSQSPGNQRSKRHFGFFPESNIWSHHWGLTRLINWSRIRFSVSPLTWILLFRNWKSQPVACGVPQGSVLAPVLFKNNARLSANMEPVTMATLMFCPDLLSPGDNDIVELNLLQLNSTKLKPF